MKKAQHELDRVAVANKKAAKQMRKQEAREAKKNNRIAKKQPDPKAPKIKSDDFSRQTK